jgi:DNA polymerase-1
VIWVKVKKHNNSGFTLVEVICAVTVLMLVVLPIFTGFIMAAKTNAAISEKLEINLILQNELEKVKAIVIEEMQNAYKLRVPLIADYGVGKNWLEAH